MLQSHPHINAGMCTSFTNGQHRDQRKINAQTTAPQTSASQKSEASSLFHGMCSSIRRRFPNTRDGIMFVYSTAIPLLCRPTKSTIMSATGFAQSRLNCQHPDVAPSPFQSFVQMQSFTSAIVSIGGNKCSDIDGTQVLYFLSSAKTRSVLFVRSFRNRAAAADRVWWPYNYDQL